MNKIKYLLANLVFLTIFLLSILFGDKTADHFSYMLGIISGVWAVMIVMTVKAFRNKDRVIKQYDERQLLKRGKCYEKAFMSLIGLLLFDGFIRVMFNFNWSSYLVGVLSLIIISLTVFTILAIKNDAYQTINMNMKTFTLSSLFIGVFNLFSFITSLIDEGFIVNNQVSNYFLNLVTGLVTIVISITLMVKKHKDEKNYEES